MDLCSKMDRSVQLNIFAELNLKRSSFVACVASCSKCHFFKKCIKRFLVNTRVISLARILQCLKECQEKTIPAFTFKNYSYL